MQKTIPKNEQVLPITPPQTASAQGGTALQLGLSHLIAGAVALGLFVWQAQFHVQQPYILLIALAAAGLCGLLCTLNLQRSLYLLESILSRLAHSQPSAGRDNHNYRNHIGRRWPLGPLFLHLWETEQRIEHYITNESLTINLREQALQQAREAAALAERNRIARELHDSIKQQIFSISASAAAAQALWQDENAESARAAIEDIQHSAKEAQVEMQALLQQLRPAPLENTSLIEALRIQAQALSFRIGAQVHVDLAALPQNERLLPGTQETIFRLVQEAFANVARHARARTVWLTLHATEQTMNVEVRDDGQGFDTTHVQAGMGLTNLRERTQELHGSIEISSQPGGGTTVLISIPLLEALRSPAEEAHRQYEQARADELARRGYQLCSNASFLGIATGLVSLITQDHAWGLVALGALLIAIYGYASGAYYRGKVASNAGRGSRPVLELGQYQYKVGSDLTGLLGLGIVYTLNVIRAMHNGSDRWLFIGAVIFLVVLNQFSRWHHYQSTERYYDLLSTQELSWELARREQILIRSLTIWLVICIAGLLFAHSLFVLPPITPAQQNAYGIAFIVLLTGIGNLSSYRQLQRWKRTLSQCEHAAPAQAKEG